jgi:16S rRNA (guanine1207-N2)-methyltransferase
VAEAAPPASVREAVYGDPPSVLAEVAPDAAQVSPLALGGTALEDLADGTLDRLVVYAPGGVLERRYVMAQALRVLKTGAELIVLAHKTRGGARLADELAAFGGTVRETAKRHHRICQITVPAAPTGVAEALAEGGPRIVEELGLWSQPGVFSWNRLDPGSALLLKSLPPLAGRGADLGCGSGVLAREVLRRPEVTALWLLDIDRRAGAAAPRTIGDDRVQFRHADARQAPAEIADLDFVVMNPPFHIEGHEDRGLGVAFIEAAARLLRRGGRCVMVANIALPYESHLTTNFTRVTTLARTGGYKVFEAVK